MPYLGGLFAERVMAFAIPAIAFCGLHAHVFTHTGSQIL